ncbi:hypothetical protein ES708_19497 [subsurface metagenome]
MSEIEEPVLERKLWGPWATVGLGLAVIIVFFTVQTLVTIAFILTRLSSYFDFSTGPPQLEELLNAIETIAAAQLGLITALAACASAIICVGLIILFARIRKGVSIAEYLGLKRITVKQILAVLGIMAGFIILSDGLGLLLDRPASNEFVVNVYSTSVWPALLWVSLIIFVPIFEETFFRGFLFEGFRQSRLGPIGAVGLTALAWAALHIQYGFYDIAVIFILGILLGIVRIRTGSLWSTLIMHAFTNMVALIQVALHLEGLIG